MLKAMIEEGRNAEVTEFVNFYGTEGTTGRTVDRLGKKSAADKLLSKVIELKPDHLWASVLKKSL